MFLRNKFQQFVERLQPLAKEIQQRAQQPRDAKTAKLGGFVLILILIAMALGLRWKESQEEDNLE